MQEERKDGIRYTIGYNNYLFGYKFYDIKDRGFATGEHGGLANFPAVVQIFLLG